MIECIRESPDVYRLAYNFELRLLAVQFISSEEQLTEDWAFVHVLYWESGNRDITRSRMYRLTNGKKAKESNADVKRWSRVSWKVSFPDKYNQTADSSIYVFKWPDKTLTLETNSSIVNSNYIIKQENIDVTRNLLLYEGKTKYPTRCVTSLFRIRTNN